EIYDDLECIGSHITRLRNGYTARLYTMKCCQCGREKDMLAPNIAQHHGTTHKACGKGIKLANKRFHDLWCAMRTRTTNSNYSHANCYSERSINSDEFKYFIDFYDKMYSSYLEAAKIYGEENISLERIDVNDNYSSKNCTWIPKWQQQGNTRRTVHFEVIFPDGHKEYHKNAHRFALEHGLDPATVTDVLQGRTSHHRHYQFIKMDN
ncbi:MAG: hypothetical protein LUE86_01395, partial [Clostridiales bacterium]|nr:hypothetical protein [Clostridiales bacterium]